MKFYILASGSKGNCTVIEDQDVKLVIDCGTTNKYLTQAFHTIDIDYKGIDALLITHSHSDHISRLNLFKDALVYTPEELSNHSNQTLIDPYESFKVGHLDICPILLSHDTEITVGYIIDNQEEKLVYVTDTGYFKDEDLSYIDNADYYIVESNHDPTLLMETRRPYYLKQRILSMDGHLSNEDAASLLKQAVGSKTKEVVLAHLSEEANDPEIALETTQKALNCDKITVRVAKQFEIIEGGYHEK